MTHVKSASKRRAGALAYPFDTPSPNITLLTTWLQLLEGPSMRAVRYGPGHAGQDGMPAHRACDEHAARLEDPLQLGNERLGVSDVLSYKSLTAR